MVVRKPPRLDYFNFDKALVTRLMDAFGVPGDIRFRPILLDGPTCSLIDVRSATSRKMVLDAGSRRLFLKQIPWYCDDAGSVRFAQAFHEAAHAAGLPVPALLRTSDGRGWVELDGAKLTLSDHASGVRFDNSEPAIADAARQLAALHLTGLSPTDGPTEPGFRNDAFEDALDHVQLARTIGDERGQRDAREPLAALARAAKEEARLASHHGWEQLDHGCVHGDFSPWNLVFDAESNQLRGIVDFDNAHRGPVVRDLAEMLVTFCWLEYAGDSTSFASRLPTRSQGWERLIIDSYQSVRPLSEQEHRCLPAVVTAVGVELSCLGFIRGDFDGDALRAAPAWLAAMRREVAASEDDDSTTLQGAST